MSPYRILHLLGTAQVENAATARIVTALARRLDPEYFEIHVLFLGKDGPLSAEAHAAGAKVRVLDWRNFRIAEVLRSLNSIGSNTFDLVHQHFGGRAIRLIRHIKSPVPVIAHLHSRVSESGGLNPGKLADSRYAAVIATSRAVAETIDREQVAVVYPGVNVNDFIFEQTQSNTNILGTAGRLVRLKGFSYLLQAFAILRRSRTDIKLEIAGCGPELEKLKLEAKDLGLDNSVHFLGWQDDLKPALSRWFAFALPSVEEGFGIAVLEAMAAGLPVVASAVGGLPELVIHGKTGLLVPPAQPAALAKAISDLLANHETALAMGIAGRVRAQQEFSEEAMVSTISDLYVRLLIP